MHRHGIVMDLTLTQSCRCCVCAAGWVQGVWPKAVWLVQASTDPEYQALLAKQQGLDAPTATQIAAGLLSQQQKEAGLASVFKRDDENLARRCVPIHS